MAHNHFMYAVLHLAKATGKLAAAVEVLDHDLVEFPDVSDALADVVICALRMANVRPGGAIDIVEAIVKRLHDKNELSPDWGR